MTRYADIDGYRVDLEALGTTAHHCDPLLCRRTGSCCTQYDIWMGRAEMERIVGLMPQAARFAPQLRSSDGELENVFCELGPDTYALEEGEDGTCPFAYGGRLRQCLCSLHSAALEAGLAPQAVKPDCCFTWPLAISGERPPVISIQVDALNFPCNRCREGDGGLDEGIAEIILGVLGRPFLSALLELL